MIHSPLVQIATEVCYMGNRRDPRIMAKLQVRIAGMDAHGRALLQIVTTRNISRHGALLEGLQGTLKPGETISITYKNNKARFRVSWVGDSGTDRAGQIGVQSVDPARCIWDAATLPSPVADVYAAPAAKERRQHRRVQCRLGAELHIEGAESLARAEVTNISVGGCFVDISTVLTAKSRLKLVVWINDTKLTFKGFVVNQRPGFGISIRFTEMSEDTREQLQRFIQSRVGLRG
jgi:hypothetical protein